MTSLTRIYMSKQIKLWFTLFPFSHQTIQSSASAFVKLITPNCVILRLMWQGVFLISLFIAWLFLPTKQVKIFTVIYTIMPIPCNNMVNFIENSNIRGSCGILWYPVVIRLTPVFVYRDKIRNFGFILSKPLGQIDFPMCPGIKFKDQPDFTGLHLLLTSVNIRSHFSDILNLSNDLSSLCLRCFCRL